MCFGGDGGDSGSGSDSGVSTRPGEEKSGEPQTYEHATSSWIGDSRSDEQISDDVAVTAAMERGADTYKDSKGYSRSVADYSRDFSPPAPGSLLAEANTAPDVYTALGAVASLMAPGLKGTLLGQTVNRGGRAIGNYFSSK